MTDDLSFSRALEKVKDGSWVSREVWEDPHQYIFLVAPSSDEEAPIEELNAALPFLTMHTTGGMFIPWTPDHLDLLTDDWYLVKEVT